MSGFPFCPDDVPALPDFDAEARRADLDNDADACDAHAVLRSATLALHDELSSIEFDLAYAFSASRLQALWAYHAKLAQFYDLDVYLDRAVAS
jgi:hypothetical protein